MKSKLSILAAVLCMGSTAAIDAQPLRETTPVTGFVEASGAVEFPRTQGSPAASRDPAPNSMDAAALKRLSTRTLVAEILGPAITWLPEEPYLGPVRHVPVMVLAESRGIGQVRSQRAAGSATAPQGAVAGRNRFESGTTWRQRQASWTGSVMGPPVDLMTEPKFVGPPLERASVPMFETPVVVAAVEAPPAPVVPEVAEPPPAESPEPAPAEGPAPAPESPPPPAEDGKNPNPGPQISGPDESTEWPDDEYPDDEYPDDEYPDDEVDGELPPVQIPETATLLLVGIGLAVMALVSGSRRRRSAGV